MVIKIIGDVTNVVRKFLTIRVRTRDRQSLVPLSNRREKQKTTSSFPYEKGSKSTDIQDQTTLSGLNTTNKVVLIIGTGEIKNYRKVIPTV